jgi:surface antigen
MRARIIVLAAAILLPGIVSAQNWSGFKDAPITRLTAEELKDYLAFLGKTLDSGPEGSTVEWKAPRTNFTSKITPLKAYTKSGQQCREATIESDARDLHQRGRYTLCRAAKGGWLLQSPGKDAGGKAQ